MLPRVRKRDRVVTKLGITSGTDLGVQSHCPPGASRMIRDVNEPDVDDHIVPGEGGGRCGRGGWHGWGRCRGGGRRLRRGSCEWKRQRTHVRRDRYDPTNNPTPHYPCSHRRKLQKSRADCVKKMSWPILPSDSNHSTSTFNQAAWLVRG